MKKIKYRDLHCWLRDKPYLYTIVGIILLIFSPLIFIYYAIKFLRKDNFFSDFVSIYYDVIKLTLMQVEGKEL